MEKMALSSRWHILRYTAITVLSLLAAAPVMADAPASTLEKIKRTGVLRVGYGNTLPFSWRGTDGKVVGYSIELCERVADALEDRIGIDEVKIEYILHTPSNRIQLLRNGTIDIDCNASTNNAERRRIVAFAPTHYYTVNRYVSLARHKLETIEDLRGRSVSVVRGTVNIGQLNQANRERKLNIALVTIDSLDAAFDTVTKEKALAFAMDDILLRTMIARAPDPTIYALSTESFDEPEPYGFMMRLEDTDFTEAVSTALHALYKSPDMENIYNRWFNGPILDGKVNLGIPMSDELKTAFISGR